MDEITNANTEGTASTPSTADAVATGASGADAGQQATEASNGQQSATPPTPEEFSAGWSYDDQPETPSSAIPESDDDIEGLTTDPNLDQKQVPKLVSDLRGARAEARQSRVKIRELTEQIAKLEQYGGVEGAGQMAGLANGLITDPANGATPFMANLAQKALPAYRAIADDLVEAESAYLISKLQAAGKLPETQAQTAGQLTAEDWQRIPKELHNVAKQVPVAQLIQWLDQGGDDGLLYNLEREAKLQQLDGAQRQQAEMAQRQAHQQAEQQGYQAIQALSDQYTKAHYAQLAKWQPFGPENGTQNQQLYSAILEGAFAQLRQDPQWETLRMNAVKALSQAPLRRLNGEHMAADADEREAHKAAARFNTRLGQVMKGMIQSLDSTFRDARQWREYQRQSAPERKEVSGISSTASNGHSNGVSALDENGNISDGFMARLTERMKGWKGA